MNDDLTELESDLRGLVPRAPSKQLEERVGLLLDQPSHRRGPAAWWQRLGFNRPFAAFGWGLVSPALTAATVLIVIHFAQREPIPVPMTSHPQSATIEMAASNPVSAADGLAIKTTPDSAQATNVVYQALDEGVVLDGGREPVHRVRYRSADLVQWRNPDTGALCAVSYPREDVRLVPVVAD